MRFSRRLGTGAETDMNQAANPNRANATADLHVLQEAFQEFSKASATLEISYKELQMEARRLSTELATANEYLQRTVAEKERVKNYLKNILQSLSNGVLVIDSKKKIQICNPAAVRILGIQDSASTQEFEDLPIAAPLREWMHAALSMQGEADDIEIQVDGGTATPRHVIVSSSWLAGSGDGESGIAFILKDITRLKELELKAQRDQKLQAMGEMAVELAHEIRNPLGSIDLFASLLASELQGNTRLKAWADQAVTSVKFLNTIVTNMLTFTRPSTPQLQPLDLLELIDGTLLFLNPVFEQRNIQVEKPDREPLLIDADEQMLWQMFINLMMNSLHAMPESGRLCVRVRESGDSVTIDIEDTGIGIPPEHLDRIFDPFFTTSEKGTGLGLSLVHQIVEKHKGTITASSEFGRGTRFTISLPLRSKERPC
jgi:signal transduction histidine kinase